MSDSAMVEGILKGTVDFAELMRRFQRLVHWWFYILVGNEALAEELTECLFERVWTHLGCYDPAKGSLATWLHRMTYNMAMNAIAHRKLGGESLDALPENREPTGPGPASEGALPNLAAILRAAEHLAPEYYEVVILCGRDGLTHAEAADRLHVSEKTVDRRWTAAVSELRRLL